jgi:proline reductase-associated electron transfer protein PrdC
MKKFKFVLKMAVGAPSKSIVKVDEEVKRGQCIAEPISLGCKIHSSIDGVVKKITDTYIEIQETEGNLKDYLKIKECENISEYAFEAGIVGSGGAGFPSHIKLSTKLNGGYVLANAAECEPVLSHNVELMEKNPEILVKGVKYAMESTGSDKGYIAMKPKYLKAAVAIGKVLKNYENIEIKWLPNMYPAGDERVIVREVLGIELQPGELPSKANAVVFNVETLKNLVLAVEDRKPVIDKDITVGGRVVNAEKGKVFLDVPIGATVKEYIEKSGGYIHPYGEIVAGGPFTGSAITEDASITKTTGGILVAMPYPKDTRKVGIIACECGATEGRLTEIAHGMGGEVVAETRCKRMVEVNGRYRCDKPGICPGQAEKVLFLKSQGAEVIITGTCED